MRAPLRAVVLGLSLLAATRASAGTITFETTPSGGTPVDDAVLADPYRYTGGSVRFFFDANGNNRYDAGTDTLPFFEHTGDDGTNGFDSNTVGTPDTARPGYEAQLGTWFLRSPSGTRPGPFIAAYTSLAPIRSLSGEIWDIDGRANTEQWQVDVLSDAGTVLAGMLSPLGDDNGPSSLDSLPWTFAFNGLPDGVASVRLTFVGSKPNGVGLAFNNFSPDVALPEPGGLFVLLPLLTGMLLRRRARATPATDRPRGTKWHAALAVPMLTFAFAPVSARAAITGFGDFSQFTVNRNDAGAAPTFPSPGTIELVNGASEARSIFGNAAQSVSQFTASFTYQVLNPGSNEGAAFILSADPRGAAAVGSGNHALSGITPSVEVTFNVGNNNSGLFTDGDATGAGVNVSPVSIASGHPIDVTFTYSGSTLSETLLDRVTLQTFTTSNSISVAGDLGKSTGFVGLTAGSANNSVEQRFSNFQFSNTVPEPSAVTLIAALAAFGLRRRRAISA